MTTFRKWWADKGQFVRPDIGSEPADRAFERAIAKEAWQAALAASPPAPAGQAEGEPTRDDNELASDYEHRLEAWHKSRRAASPPPVVQQLVQPAGAM